MATGHITDRNLSESNTRDKDSRAIDNLGGEGMSNDISLFINNKNNTSIIAPEEYTIQNNFIVLLNQFIVPFSNRTIVTVGEIECIVINSNFMDRFQLLRKNDNTIFIPTLSIIRSDTIYLKNFELLNPERNPPTKSLSDTSISGLLSGNIDSATETNIYESLNIITTISNIDEIISVYKFRKKNAIQLNNDNDINHKLIIGGSILIETLDDNMNPITNQSSLSDNDPGIFLTNSGNKVRAFSDSSNPWDTTSNAGYNTTQSTKTTVIELTVESLNISGISIQTSGGNITSATHKIPVVINGEKYNILSILS